MKLESSSKEFNVKRREILIKMDKNGDKCIPNIVLGMYDLTPYYNNEDIDSKLYEKILFLENEKRHIMHISEKKLYFMPEQIKALNFIKENSRIIISAPTSFGKTLIIKEYIHKYNPKKIVYIVPTNALSYELENNFKLNSKFDKYNIYDKNKGEYEINDEWELFVGTQEKFLEIKNNFSTGIDLFVIDEAYKLNETTLKQRGYRLSDAFIDSISKNSNKIVLLSPNAKFIGFERYEFKLFQTYFNAVDKIFHTVKANEFYDLLYKKAKVEKTILFCEKPANISSIFEKVKKLKSVDNNFIDFLEQEFHPEWLVVKYLKIGIAIHHGQMPKFVQNKMIKLFNDASSGYNLLIGTNSISEGINTPTKNLFFHPNCSLKNNELQVKNTIGRAGRLGEYPIGHIYCINSLINEINEKEITVELAINNEINEKEITDSLNDSKISLCASEYKLDELFIKDIVKEYKISLSRLMRVLDEFRKDSKYVDLRHINSIVSNVFKEEHPFYLHRDDDIYIRGTLQSYYFIKTENTQVKRMLSNYNDKIEFYRYKKKDYTIEVSTIIEGYMQFIYNTLEHLICPIVNIGYSIMENYPLWKFGNNVCEILKKFRVKYSQKIYGFDLDKFTDNQKKIALSLKEYGVSLKSIGINNKIIEEIEKELNVRFSTYDIVKAISRLSKKSSNKLVFNLILEKYF